MTENVQASLERARKAFAFSAYSFWGEGKNGVLQFSGGNTSYWGISVKPVSQDSLFDIASLTKVVATVSILARAVDKEVISLEDKVTRFLPELKPLQEVTIGSLLSHSAGFTPWVPLYRENPSDILQWFVENDTRLRRKQGAVYDDLSFIILGFVIERIFSSVGEAFEESVRHPLKLKDISFGPVSAYNAVATEFHLERGKLLQGEVFDENCHFLKGMSGHAGLFATARALVPWAREWLKAVAGESNWLSQETARLFTTKVKETWAYGWDTPSLKGSSAGSLFSEASFGHLGFTGCSIWIDPKAQHFALLLTNRVHPSRFDKRIRKIRPEVHNAWAEFCGR